jgi:hypothetical protein
MVIKFNRGDAVIKHVGLNEARARLGAVIERVRVGKEYVVLEKAESRWLRSWISRSLKICWSFATPRCSG